MKTALFVATLALIALGTACGGSTPSPSTATSPEKPAASAPAAPSASEAPAASEETKAPEKAEEAKPPGGDAAPKK